MQVNAGSAEIPFLYRSKLWHETSRCSTTFNGSDGSNLSGIRSSSVQQRLSLFTCFGCRGLCRLDLERLENAVRSIPPRAQGPKDQFPHQRTDLRDTVCGKDSQSARRDARAVGVAGTPGQQGGGTGSGTHRDDPPVLEYPGHKMPERGTTKWDSRRGYIPEKSVKSAREASWHPFDDETWSGLFAVTQKPAFLFEC